MQRHCEDAAADESGPPEPNGVTANSDKRAENPFRVNGKNSTPSSGSVRSGTTTPHKKKHESQHLTSASSQEFRERTAIRIHENANHTTQSAKVFCVAPQGERKNQKNRRDHQRPESKTTARRRTRSKEPRDQRRGEDKLQRR